MESIKQFSATKANKILQREGEFWQRESYDYQVRNRNELFRIISYILDNPVKAGLCVSRDQWKWSYIKSFTMNSFEACDLENRVRKGYSILESPFRTSIF